MLLRLLTFTGMYIVAFKVDGEENARLGEKFKVGGKNFRGKKRKGKSKTPRKNLEREIKTEFFLGH